MKYFIDTEFIEGFHKPLFGKRRHFIDLISIGIVAEDGRECYAVSTEFNPKDANDWVKDNVIAKLPTRYAQMEDSPRIKEEARLWKSNKHIAEDIIAFVNNDPKGPTILTRPEFYAYYADYDWVVFCSLFGRMIDLPAGFPMYCRDLKQMLDEKAMAITQKDFSGQIVKGTGWDLIEGAEISRNIVDIEKYTLDMRINLLKLHEDYPEQENEHSALDDAKWNFELYKFLQKL